MRLAYGAMSVSYDDHTLVVRWSAVTTNNVTTTDNVILN